MKNLPRTYRFLPHALKCSAKWTVSPLKWQRTPDGMEPCVEEATADPGTVSTEAKENNSVLQEVKNSRCIRSRPSSPCETVTFHVQRHLPALCSGVIRGCQMLVCLPTSELQKASAEALPPSITSAHRWVTLVLITPTGDEHPCVWRLNIWYIFHVVSRVSRCSCVFSAALEYPLRNRKYSKMQYFDLQRRVYTWMMGSTQTERQHEED